MPGHPGLPGMKVSWRPELFGATPKIILLSGSNWTDSSLSVFQGPQRCQRGSGRTWKTRAQGKTPSCAFGIKPMLVNSGQVIVSTRIHSDAPGAASIALKIIKVPLHAAIFCIREQLRAAQTRERSNCLRLWDSYYSACAAPFHKEVMARAAV